MRSPPSDIDILPAVPRDDGAPRLQSWQRSPDIAIAARARRLFRPEYSRQIAFALAHALSVSRIMPTTVFALLVLAGAGLYFMTPEERVRLGRSVIARIRVVVGTVTESSVPGEPFDEFLRARTRWAIVTPL